MLIHLFNSSSVSGPERLVLPALASAATPCVIVNLRELRIEELRETDPLEEYALSLHLPYHAINVRGRWDRQAIGELHALLHRLKPDLVHAHGIKASVYLLRTRRKNELHDIPIVTTHHGVHGLPDRKVQFYEWFYRRHILKNFDRTLAVSSADYAFLMNSGIDKSRLRLHLNGIDGRWIDPKSRPDEAQKARLLWLPKDLDGYRPFLFGVIARLSPEKDHARLLRVLSSLNQIPCNRDWKCLIFGSGALENVLRHQAKQLGLEKRLLWMGYRKNVADELAGLDLLLSFSKAEGLPINVIEAGWAGTPVRCTGVGGIADLIPDKSYGSTIASDEQVAITAIDLLPVLSPEGHVELEEQGRRLQKRVVQEFSQKKWVHRLTEIYSELGVSFEGPQDAEPARHSFDHLESPSPQGTLVRLIVLLVIGFLSTIRGLEAEIPQPPILMLTAQDNGTQPQSLFSCSGPIHGYVTLPHKARGKHVLEGLWTGPKGTLVQHSRDEVEFPANGSRHAEVWLHFKEFGGGLWNPLSTAAPADTDGPAYNGTWKVEIRWDAQTLARSDFTVQCKNF